MIPDIQVRSDLVEQLPDIATICQKAPHLFGDVLHDHLLGIIIKYLQDSDNEVNICMFGYAAAPGRSGRRDKNLVRLRNAAVDPENFRQPFRSFPETEYRNAARIIGPIDEYLLLFRPSGTTHCPESGTGANEEGSTRQRHDRVQNLPRNRRPLHGLRFP